MDIELKCEEKLEDLLHNAITLVVCIVMSMFVGYLLNGWFDIITIIGLKEERYMLIICIMATAITFALVASLITEVIFRIITDVFRLVFKDRLSFLYKNKLIYVVATIGKTLVFLYGLLLLLLFGASVKGIDIEIDKFGFKYTNKIVSRAIDEVYNNALMTYSEYAIASYNGTTIKKAIESTPDIDARAQLITRKADTSLEKAKIIYDWIGINIKYDKELADNVTQGVIDDEYGAKYGFETRSGICFDFTALYAAMAKSIDLPVKIVFGEAFNGEEYGPHTWNQVYLEDEDRWIDVDSTFWGHEDSFDTDIFSATHKTESIIEELGN